ncbi:hypothetical protein Golomagni_01529 [Golovinomyces magnicellulatus]|nr:hypothetical protein Golomagni_01529 [Golovinomyces magnicellulatus]
MTAGLKTIISLSFILAIGFLLVILSCALFHQYLPLLVVVTYVLAPLPNWICGRCANPDDFVSDNSGNAIVDFGKFCTGILVFMGLGMYTISFGALPITLAHSDIIRWYAAVMSIVGGALIYATIIIFGMFFHDESEF